MVSFVFAGTAAIGTADRKRADSGIDGTSDRTAKRHCNSVFLLWGNTVGDCKGTWHYTATSFSDACDSTSAGCGTVRRKTVPLERKRILKELNEKLKEMGIMGGCFSVKFKKICGHFNGENMGDRIFNQRGEGQSF